MARRSDFEVLGGQKLERELLKLPSRIMRNVVPVALRKGASLIVRAARNSLDGRPYATGALKKSLGTKLERNKFTIQAGARRKIGQGGRHAHLVEFGHGGPKAAPAHPFLEPAVQSTKNAAFNAVKTELAAWLRLLK